MSRLMSVSYTADQVVARTKTVTRRLGWRFLKPGDRLTLCRKVMGRKPGEPLERLAEVRVILVNREQLWQITSLDVVREGFPSLDRLGFVLLFQAIHPGRIGLDTMVTRIEWEYL